MSKKIVLTGGGTAGHITPNIALLPSLRQLGYEISYIGSYEGMEKKLIGAYDIPYYGISTGKFRRYFDLKNFTDPFRVIRGYVQSRRILKEIRPDVVFFQGRLRRRSRGARGGFPQNPLRHPRIRYDAGPCE